MSARNGTLGAKPRGAKNFSACGALASRRLSWRRPAPPPRAGGGALALRHVSPTRGRRDADRSAAETAAVHTPERRRPAGRRPAPASRAGGGIVHRTLHTPIRAARTPPGQPPRRRRSGFGCGSAALWSLWSLCERPLILPRGRPFTTEHTENTEKDLGHLLFLVFSVASVFSVVNAMDNGN